MKSNIGSIPIDVVGMVWYRLEDYDAIRGIMADGHKLPATFSEWRMKAETGEKKLRRDRKIVVRAYIDPETFPDWCRARGLNVDAKARMEFANGIAYDTVMRSQGEAPGTH